MTSQHALAPTNIDAISAFSHRSARLILSLCRSEARYARLRDLVEQELGAFKAMRSLVAKHIGDYAVDDLDSHQATAALKRGS